MTARNGPAADELRARARAAEQEERAAVDRLEAFGVRDPPAEWSPEYEQACLDARQAWVKAEMAFHELDAFLHPRRYARKGYQGERHLARPSGKAAWFNLTTPNPTMPASPSLKPAPDPGNAHERTPSVTSQPDPYPDRLRYVALNLARRAFYNLAEDAGIHQFIARPAYRNGPMVDDLVPLSGADVARQIELAAREHARDYIRLAREAGCTWHQIGTAMALVPGGDAQQAGDTAAEAAFTYAAGHPDSGHARRYGRSVAWHRGSCDRAISDHGLCNGPADDERGHASNCTRLAATVAKDQAEWEAPDAEWEAGQ